MSGPFLFLGSPKVAAEILEMLLVADCPISGIVTKEPKRRSRGGSLVATPVEEVAKKFKLEVYYSLQNCDLSRFKLGIVVAYGKIIGRSVLSSLPMVNIHFSLLPKFRGAAPVERALLNGDIVTGVTLMEIDHELDAGKIYDQIEVAIAPSEDINSLYSKLTLVGAEIVIKNLTAGVNSKKLTSTAYSLSNLPMGHEQNGEVTWAPKIADEELRITDLDSAMSAMNKIKIKRAYFYFLNKKIKIKEAGPIQNKDNQSNLPLLSLYLQDNKLKLKLHNGGIELISVVPESKSQMSGVDFYNGYVKPKDFFVADGIKHQN